MAPFSGPFFWPLFLWPLFLSFSPPEQAERVPQVLISVGRRYVQYINHIDGRTGTLWDGRYKSSLVQAETYLLLCQR